VKIVETFTRLTLGAIGALGLLAAVVKRGPKKASPESLRLLKHLAKNKSSSVPELSSRLKLTTDETERLLAEFEKRGWVQLSGDQGAAHVRIAAITRAGREQIP